MAERWKYAERNHPPYCTCVECKGDGSRHRPGQPLNQLRTTLENWRSRNFDPHFILGVSPNSSRELIAEAHRRRILAYHPDKHQDDPLATELTKRLNAARDELLGKRHRGSQSQSEQQRRRQEAQQRARETERRSHGEERQKRADKAEQQRTQEEARQQGVREAERLMRDAERRRQDEERLKRARKAEQQRRQKEARRSQEEARRQRSHENARRKQDDEQRKRARKAEQQRRQEEARLRQEEARRQRSHENARRRQHSRPPVQSVRHMRRKGSLLWSLLTIALASLVIAYLFATVEYAGAVDSMMDEWARLFDQALARQ